MVNASNLEGFMSNTISASHAHLARANIAQPKALNPAQQAKAAHESGREFGQLVASLAKGKQEPAAPQSATAPTGTRPAASAETGGIADL